MRRALAIDEQSYGPDHPRRRHRPQQPGAVAPGHEPSGGGRAADAAHHRDRAEVWRIDGIRASALAWRIANFWGLLAAMNLSQSEIEEKLREVLGLDVASD